MQAEKCWPVKQLCPHHIQRQMQACFKLVGSKAVWMQKPHDCIISTMLACCSKPDGETEYISSALVSAEQRQSKLTSVCNLSGSSMLCLKHIIPLLVLLAHTQTEAGSESYSVCFPQMNLLIPAFCQRQQTCVDRVQLCSAVPPCLSWVPGLYSLETLYTPHLHLHFFSLPATDYFLDSPEQFIKKTPKLWYSLSIFCLSKSTRVLIM